MEKVELMEKIQSIVDEKVKGKVLFPEIQERTFLKALILSDQIKTNEEMISIFKENDWKEWQLIYLNNIKGLTEALKEKETKEENSESSTANVFIVDFLSSEYLDGWRRTQADFLNYKRDEKERIAEMLKFGNANIIADLITVLDSFDLGLATIHDEVIRKGILLIKNQLEDVLKKYGLERVEVKEGEVFDPLKAEIVELKESDLKEGTIIEVLTVGYKLYDKILKPARVIVSKGQLKQDN